MCLGKRDYDKSADTDISGQRRNYVYVTIIQSVFAYSRLLFFVYDPKSNTELQWIFSRSL